MPQHGRICGNLSPSQKFQAFLLHNDLKHLLCLIFLKLILGKEEHAHTVFPGFSDGNSKRGRYLLKKLMGDLCENSHTVTGLSLCILSCAVLQVFHYFQCIFHCRTALFALNVYAGTDTAVVMFKFRTVKGGIRLCPFYIKHAFLHSEAYCFFFPLISSLVFLFVINDKRTKKGRKELSTRSFATFVGYHTPI